MGNDRKKAEDTAGLLAVGGGAALLVGGGISTFPDGFVRVVGLILAVGGLLALLVALIAYGVELGLRSSGVQEKLDRVLEQQRKHEHGQP